MASSFSGRAGRLAANYGQQIVGDAYNQAKTDLGAGFDRASKAYTEAKDLYAPGAQNYGAYSGMYANALGLGGQQGTDAAMAAFRGTNPGYGFALDQGLQAVQRQAAAGGRAASGGALMEAQRYGQGLADQNYQNWLRNLLSGQQMAGQAVQGQAQALDALGRTGYGYGSDLANLGTQWGDKAASIGMSGLMAGQQAAQNRVNAVMGGARMLTDLAGSIFGGMKGGGSGLFSGGGGG